MATTEDELVMERRVSDETHRRIEAKIDQIFKALETLIRLEERMKFYGDAIERLEGEVARYRQREEERADEAVREAKEASTTVDKSNRQMIERIVWAAVAAALGGLGVSGTLPTLT